MRYEVVMKSSNDYRIFDNEMGNWVVSVDPNSETKTRSYPDRESAFIAYDLIVKPETNTDENS